MVILLVCYTLRANDWIHSQHAEAEKNFKPKYFKLAHGDLNKKRTRSGGTRYTWPVALKSIGHTMASYQRYGGLNGAYFHHGLDIRADAGSDVIASAGGQVVNIENYMPGDDAYWEVAILDAEGFIWQYHHIERESIPKAIFDAYQNKTSIAPGTKLGEVYYWSVVTFGERYHHIHLNILGNDKKYLNPFEFLELLPDDSAPEIGKVSLVVNGNAVTGNSVSGGSYTIGAEIKDLILSDVFIVPANEIKVSIDGNSSFTVWKFDSLPGGADNEKFVNQFYLPKLACGDYSCRKPIIDLGFRKTPGQVFPVSRGNHQIEITISDYNGNQARQTFGWTVN
ncbi:MAG: peptidoglycan DD-metalloendopeptidase family protein [Deltaproteobacteria bacterium]